MYLARKIALDQVAYENKARGVGQCNEGTIGDEAVNNPNPIGCNVIETIGV